MEKKSLRWWDLPSALLLFVAYVFAAGYLQATDWTEGLGHVRNISLYGLIIGLALGVSKFQKRGIRNLSFGYMVVLFCWQWFRFMEFPEDINYIGTKLLMLGSRLGVGLGELFANRPIEDPLFFIALLSFPYWFAAIYGGYQLTRHANGFAAILPGGILMFSTFINLYTDKDYTWLFAVYIFLSLIILARQKYIVDKKGWYRDRIQFSSESGTDLNNIIMASAALLIFVVWAVPKALPYIQDAKENWDATSKRWFEDNERMDNIFASVEERASPINDFVRDQLALGSETPQSENVVFLVYTPPAAQNIPRLYWRGRVYDVYLNGYWQTSNIDQMAFTPEQGSFGVPDIARRVFISFTYNVLNDGQTLLYAASQSFWVSHAANMSLISIETEDIDVTESDVFSMEASPALSSGETYATNSLIANPSIVELQEAGAEYPAWVTTKYLQLPQDVSPRITDLALEITDPFDNPYDKAAAVTKYLRDNIEYTPTVTIPEDTADYMEYFLFESKQGFCNYYASAEVLMLRSLGIPARLAVGYSAGDPSDDFSFYTVREKNYHAWPEVYFPSYGWIEFEPTGNQNPVERPLEPAEIPNVAANQPLTQLDFNESDLDLQRQPIGGLAPNESFIQSQTFQILLVIVAVLLSVVGIFFVTRRYSFTLQPATAITAFIERSGWTMPAWLTRWIRWNALTTIEKYFQSINTSLNWFGSPQPIHITPAERADILKQLLPSAADAIDSLLHELESALFSPRGGSVKNARKAAGDIIYQFLISRLKFLILGYN